MKSRVSLTALAPLTLLGAITALAQPAAPEQALRELNIMRNIFNAAMEDNGNRRFQIDGPEALYLHGQGMVFTFDMPGGNSLFDFNGDDFSLFSEGDFNFSVDFDYDDDAGVGIADNGNTNAPPPPQAPQAPRTAQVGAQAEALAGYRDKLEAINQQMRDKQDAMRSLQRSMREQQRAQLRNDEADFDDTEMDKLSDEMEKIGDEISSISNNMDQIRQAYESERNTAVAALHQQKTAVIFDTLCNYGTTLRSLQNGEHVNLVLRNREAGISQVYVVQHAKLANCSSGSALQQAATAYTLPERNDF